MQKDLRPDQHVEREGNLYEPQEDGEERSDNRFVRNFSLYTAAQTHPRTTAALALLAGAAAAGAVTRGRPHRLTHEDTMPKINEDIAAWRWRTPTSAA